MAEDDQKEYVVTWEIGLLARSRRAAALACLQWLREERHTDWIWRVKDANDPTDEGEQIDLDDSPPLYDREALDKQYAGGPPQRATEPEIREAVDRARERTGADERESGPE